MAPNSKIIVYGTEWCGDTRRAKRILNENHIDYEYINIDKDKEAEALVKQINNGYRSVPTIFLPDGSTITEPSNEELKTYLAEFGLINKLK